MLRLCIIVLAISGLSLPSAPEITTFHAPAVSALEILLVLPTVPVPATHVLIVSLVTPVPALVLVALVLTLAHHVVPAEIALVGLKIAHLVRVVLVVRVRESGLIVVHVLVLRLMEQVRIDQIIRHRAVRIMHLSALRLLIVRVRILVPALIVVVLALVLTHGLVLVLVLHGLVLVYVVVVVSALVLLFLLRLTRPLPKKDLRLKLGPTEVRLELIPLELSRQTKIIDLLLQPFEVPLQRLVKNCPFFRMRADFEQTFESRIHVLELGVLALLARLRLATRAL